MTADNAAEAPNIATIIPVFGIGSYDEAVAHYVDWLGFNLDWEWRSAPGRPVIMAISRPGVGLMLNEANTSAVGSSLVLHVRDLQALADEWNSRRPESVAIDVQPPYDIPCVSLTDPFGNCIHFQQPVSEEEQATRRRRRVHMREYIRARLADGHACPTPEEVVDAVGRPLGLAMDTLNEFPEYEEATREDN